MNVAVPAAFEEQMLALVEKFEALNLNVAASGGYYKDRADRIAKQLSEKEFRITVVGDFSAGKSTFLNALIGKDILPHAVTETTATVTYIRNVPLDHPSADTIVVHFNDNKRPDTVLNLKENPDALKMYTTTQSSLNVASDISHVDIYVNFKNTDEKVVFIDTPGLNGLAKGHRDLTMHEIKQAHASICLFHLRSLAQNNLEFLQVLRKHQSSFLFVLNFIDEIKSSEGDTVEQKLQWLQEQLQVNLPEDRTGADVRIRAFGVSALKAIVSKDHSIPRLYSTDLVNLTPEDRERLMQESLFQEFEDYLWKEVLYGEKDRVFRHSLYSAFQSLLEEISEEMAKAISFNQLQLNEQETLDIERRLVQIDEFSVRNWEKLSHYMNSRHSGLEKLVKEKIAEDVAFILTQIREKVSGDDFEAFELAIQHNTYSNLVENKISSASYEYQYYLNEILEEVYQTSILKAQEYAPSVEINTEGNLVIKAVQFDGSQYKFEKQMDKLQLKKSDYAAETMKITVEQEDMVKELKQIELREKKAKSGILEAATNETTEQNRLGREPEVQQYTETRYRTVERHRFSPARLFGSSTYEEAYTATVTDTSARDQWQRNKRQIQDKYAKITDELQQESIELRIRKKQFETKAVQHKDMLARLQTKLLQVDEDIRRKQIEHEEIMLKARNEFLRSEKRRLLEQIEKFLNERIYYALLDSTKHNVEENMTSIRGQVQVYYERNQEQARQRLQMMLQSSRDEMQQQLAPYEALQQTVSQLYEELKDIQLPRTAVIND